MTRKREERGALRAWASFRRLPTGWKCVVTLLLATVIVLFWAWTTNLVPYAAVWGSVADWVTAIATVGALTTIFVQIAQWRADQREAAGRQRARDKELAETRRREQEAFATSLGAEFKLRFDSDVGSDVIGWKIRNASQYPMLNVRVMISPDAVVHDIGTLLPMSDDSGEAHLPDAYKAVTSTEGFFIEYKDVWGGHRSYPRGSAHTS